MLTRDNGKSLAAKRGINITGGYTAAPILVFALTVLFSSICFMLNITSITFSLILALAVTAVFGIIYDRRVLISLAVTVFLSLVSIKIAGRIYDISYDGMYFHKEAVYALANGWNPWRVPFVDYSYLGKIQDVALWLDNYPKGVWSFYACIYSIFGKIEYAKGANIVFVLMLFFAAYDTISSVFNKKGILCFLLSVVFAANTVIVSQYFTFMNDLPVAALTMVCAFLGMKIYAGKATDMDYICLAAAFSSSFAVKFTAPIFCGAVLAAYGIAFAVKNKGKGIIKPCVVVISAAAIGACVMAADPYIKHIANGQNPIYPLMGEGSYDIMNTNAPAGIDDMPNALAMLTSIFSKMSPNPGDVPELKIPFTIDTSFELWAAGAPDARTSGFGLFFSGILIVALAMGVYALRKSKGASAVIPALAMFTLLALFFPESWWARYNPYIYYIPCLLLLAFSCADKTKIAAFGMCALMLINSAASGFLVLRNFYEQTGTIKAKIYELNETDKHVLLNINDFPCHEIWFNENDVDFELITELRDEEYDVFYQTTFYQLEDKK